MQMSALVFLAASAAAAPQQFFSNNQQQFVNQPQFTSPIQPEVRILSQRSDQDQIGNYEFAYEQSNGQKVEERGTVQPGPQPETGSLQQQGSYEYVSNDGVTIRVDYVANEGGFQPQGAHLPVAPAQIPEYEQLRREHPELFWAENQSQGIIRNDQQFIQPPQQFVQPSQQFFQSQQFDQNQFVF